MKTNFKKTLAVLLAVLMLSSVFSVTVFAAVYTANIDAGTAEGSTLKAELADGTPITPDMLSIETNNSGKFNLPDEAYFEREDYVVGTSLSGLPIPKSADLLTDEKLAESDFLGYAREKAA